MWQGFDPEPFAQAASRVGHGVVQVRSGTRPGRVVAADKLYDLAQVETDLPVDARVDLAPEESITLEREIRVEEMPQPAHR